MGITIIFKSKGKDTIKEFGDGVSQEEEAVGYTEGIIQTSNFHFKNFIKKITFS